MSSRKRLGHERVVVAGVGATPFSRNSGVTETTLAVSAIKAAIADSGFALCNIDGIVRYSADSTSEAALVNALGLADIGFHAEIGYGGTAAAGAVALAHAAIASGKAECVVCYRAMNGRSGVRFGRGERMLVEHSSNVGYASGCRTFGSALTAPFGLLSPSQVMGMWAHRYAYEVGLDDAELAEGLAAVAVSQRAYAAANQNAIFRDKPLTLADYTASRVIATPLRSPDFCPEVDGAVALVISSMTRALDAPCKPVEILAAQQFLPRHGDTPALYAERLDRTVPSKARNIFSRAGVGPADVDVAAFYDATSVMVLMALEDYGFCERGEAPSFVAGGQTRLTGKLPTNTHGGMLGEGYLHGINNLPEIVRQLRGDADNQVPHARIGFFSAGYGSIVLEAL